MSIRQRLSVWSIACLALGAISAPWPADAQSFYERKEEGWFWYNEEPEPEPEELEELPPPEPVIVVTEPEPDEPQVAQPAGPMPLSAAWLRENMPKYLDIAIDNPTPENVKAYLYLQRISMDKAERYAMMSQRVNIGNPFLDETIRRPAATFAVSSLDTMAGIARGKLVKEIANKAGIFFFFQSDCSLCTLQAPLLKSLETQEGFAIVPVSIDGKNLPDSPWQEFRTDSGQAAMLGVQNLPATYLVGADGTMVALGQSVFALPELQERIIKAALHEGWITEEQANQTRPIRNFDNLADILEDNDQNNMVTLAQSSDTEDGFIAPDSLLQYINKKVKP